MEHAQVNPNLETETSEKYIAEGLQGEGVEKSAEGLQVEVLDTSVEGLQVEVLDTNVAGPSESKESLLTKLEINQSIEDTQFKNNNGDVESIVQDKESGKNYYICKFCSQVFDKHQALGGHMNGHSKEQRNLEKFGKVTTWIQDTYPKPLNTTLESGAQLQGTPTNEATSNSHNSPVEIKHELQYNQVQEPQHYQYLQRLQSNQAQESLQSSQALQSPQNYRAPQRLQNYQSPQRLQNHQIPQGSQSHQILQEFQNNQSSQEFEYYQGLQRFQNYQTPQGPQSYQAPEESQNYLAPQEYQNYLAPQESHSYLAPRQSQSYPTPRQSQSYPTPQGSQNYPTLQGQQQQFVTNTSNKQNINLNFNASNKSKSLAKVPSDEQISNSSNSQSLPSQKEVEGSQRYMSNLQNLDDSDRLIVRPFINEQLNKEYYAKFRANILERNNHMISIPYTLCKALARERLRNSPSTFVSKDQSRVDPSILNQEVMPNL